MDSWVTLEWKNRREEYMQMVAYLFKLGYDLTLAPRDYLSDSLEFE
jgi:hypothetical protein